MKLNEIQLSEREMYGYVYKRRGGNGHLKRIHVIKDGVPICGAQEKLILTEDEVYGMKCPRCHGRGRKKKTPEQIAEAQKKKSEFAEYTKTMF